MRGDDEVQFVAEHNDSQQGFDDGLVARLLGTPKLVFEESMPRRSASSKPILRLCGVLADK